MDKTAYILTLPSFNNYGGVLQAYALQHVLQKLSIRNKQICYLPRGLAQWFDQQGIRTRLGYWKILVKILLGKGASGLPMYLVARFFTLFREWYMNIYKLNTQRTQLSKLAKADRFIVGSDQVWRCKYARQSENVPFFFLSFATQEQRKRSIAYAASFGKDEWEGSPEETAECARLIGEFKAVSVREYSGIRLCREVFGVEAVHMPDPTLLLEPEDYSRLIRSLWTCRSTTPFMAIYLLDESDENKQLAQSISSQYGLYPQQLTPHEDAVKAMDRLPLTVPQWLRFMLDCECLITDSYHGCVFAIMFNKPFVCLGNKSRGSTRFDSLLDIFGLQDRLLINPSSEQVQKLMDDPIDWSKINNIRAKEKQRGLDFLKENL